MWNKKRNNIIKKNASFVILFLMVLMYFIPLQPEKIEIVRVASAADNPGAPYSIPARILNPGSSGDDVKWVQQCLNETIGASLVVDGIYGNETIYAVKVFQGNYGLTVDGAVGPNTTNKMLEVWLALKNKDTQAPTISNISVSEVSLSGYRVTCTVVDNKGVTEVQFPTWTTKGGQDDLIWHVGSISGSTATYYVKASDHTSGHMNYITHIYAKDAAGNQSFADAGTINLAQLGNKQDLGDDFYGVIQNTTTQTVLQNTEKADSKDASNSRVVQAYHLTGEETQLWHFEKMTNGSYEITSLSDNRKLAYYNTQDVTGTQVWAYTSNSSDGQRWYFYQAANGVYYIQGAACQDTLLDLYGCSATDGSNFVLHQINKSDAQKFAVKKYYKVSFRSDGEEVKVEWVAEGNNAIAPDLNKNGYILSWDKDFRNINDDVTVNAVWTKEAEPAASPTPTQGNSLPSPTSTPWISWTPTSTSSPPPTPWSPSQTKTPTLITPSSNPTVSGSENLFDDTSVLKESQSITAKSFSMSKGARKKLNVATDGDGILSYRSSNPKVVRVSDDGIVRATGFGKATITIFASETDRYYKTVKTIIVKVNRPQGVSAIKLNSKKKGKITIAWKKVKGISGYHIYLSRNKKFGKGSYEKRVPAKKKKVSATNLYRGKVYYVKVRTYQKVNKKKYYSTWSKVKKIKIK